MGKKVKKVIRKVTKPVEKAVKKVAEEVARPIKQVAGALAGGNGGVQVVEVPQPTAAATPAATPAAQIVDVPEKDVSTEDAAQTESGRRKARSGGKKSLSVARSSGGGINI